LFQKEFVQHPAKLKYIFYICDVKSEYKIERALRISLWLVVIALLVLCYLSIFHGNISS
jgi:hypothetical protein